MSYNILWMKSISARTMDPIAEVDSHRNPFLKDVGILVHSNCFKRLAHKTQVHSLPTNDHIRTRLTHSIEVSQIGRQLARAFCDIVLRKCVDKAFYAEIARDIEEVTNFSCLAHDIGHPPFGHKGKEVIEALSGAQHDFDDNKQVTRILLNEILDENLKVSAPAVASALKKFSLPSNCYKMEEHHLELILNELGLSNVRHPCSILMEAADDIAYLSADLLDYLTYIADARDFQNKEYQALREKLDMVKSGKKSLADELENSMKDNRFKEFSDLIIKVGITHAITSLTVFATEFAPFGSAEEIPQKFKQFLEKYAYQDHQEGKVKLDYNLIYLNIPGTGAIGRTLKEVKSLGYRDVILSSRNRAAQDLHAERVLQGIWDFFETNITSKESPYLQLLPRVDKAYLQTQMHQNQRERAVLDVISGMTDRYATKLYECISNPLLFRTAA
jgi:predicted deoxyguanosinetriphosphate triphosphohydrolase